MRILRPGEKRQAPKPSEVEARDLGRLLAVGQYALSDAEKARFEQRRVLQADKDVVGGFVILPESYSNQILTELNDAVFIRSLATGIELKYAASLGIPFEDNAGDDASWTSELATGAEDTSIDFEKRRLMPHPSAKRVKLSRTLAQRSAGFQTWAISRLAYKFALTEEKAFLTGSGANRPVGLFTTPTAGALGISSDRDISTGNSASEIKADNLIEVLMSLKAQYRKNAVWVFHRDAIKQIRKLKDGQGNYLLQVGISADKPDTILGKRYYESEYAPNTFTTGQLVGLCGDLSYYWVCTALAMEVSVLTELYAEQNCVGLIGRMEVDAAPILENAFCRVKLA
jgi:HK97 family phage major capsid protein